MSILKRLLQSLAYIPMINTCGYILFTKHKEIVTLHSEDSFEEHEKSLRLK